MTELLTNQSRRNFLKLSATGLLMHSRSVSAFPKIINECLDPRLISTSKLEENAWQGINPENWWDCHAHIVGSGDSDSGITLSSDLSDPLLHPIQYIQHLAYENAACTGNSGEQDIAFVSRLMALMEVMPKGAKAMLYAFDKVHGANGDADHINTAFFVPNEYAQSLAQRYPERLEWVASIHPYRKDCVAKLEKAVEQGAKAIKWLPSVMGIDPSSPLCKDFYRTAAKLNIPIISHGGEEKALHGANQAIYSNPLRLRHAMDEGVRVVVAHCASIGNDINDQGKQVRSFDLFSAMMEDKQWQQHLYGDISAIVLRNREIEVVKTLLTQTAWHNRLLYGSDYPLTGVLPLISAKSFVDSGLLETNAIEPLMTLQSHHPFRFDFVLKRSLKWQGQSFANSIFETKAFFNR